MPEEEKLQVEVRQSAKFNDLKHVRSEQYISLYSNYAQCAFTPWDIRITFSDIAEAKVDEAAYVDLATITLPPAIAKALITVLQQNVRLYEADFGEIKLPGKPKEKEQAEGAPIGVIDATEKPLAG